MPSMCRVQSPFSKESEFLGSNSQCCGLGYPLWNTVGMVRLSLGYKLYSRPCLAPSFCVGGGGTPPSFRLEPKLPLKPRSCGPQSHTQHSSL